MQNLSVIYKTVNVTVSVSGTFHHRTALNPFLNGTKSVDFDSSVLVNEALYEIVICINFIATNINMCVLHFLRYLPILENMNVKCKQFLTFDENANAYITCEQAFNAFM